MKISGFRHCHLVEMDVKGRHAKLVVIFTASTRTVVSITMRSAVSCYVNGGNELSSSLFAIDLIEKML